MKSFQLYYMFLLVILLFMSADGQGKMNDILFSVNRRSCMVFSFLFHSTCTACNGLNKRDCRHDGRCIWNKAGWYCMRENAVWKGGSCFGLPKWDCKNRMNCRWNRWSKVCGQNRRNLRVGYSSE